MHKEREIRSVSFIGFGRSNRGIYEYLSKKYKDISFSVRSDVLPCALPKAVKAYTGAMQFSEMNEDIYFVSPAVRRDIKELSHLLLSSDAELFFEKNTAPVFALTGTDGKSTTAALTEKLISPSFAHTLAVGNIGRAFSPHLNDVGSRAYVAELSSFQLMEMKPKALRALITNISPSHLNWHTSLGEYTGAKENILSSAEEIILSPDTALSVPLMKKHSPRTLFSYKLGLNELMRLGAEKAFYIKNGAIYKNSEKIMEISSLARREHYNIKNFMAALALADGYYDSSSLKAAADFTGLPHRFEKIFSKSGIPCYNSSIDSSPDRTLATLSAYDGAFVLLIGGRSKNHNYEILAPVLEGRAKAIVITGENRAEIARALKSISTPKYDIEDFREALTLALSLSSECLPLIFSPASTSFDRFSNFEARGDEFKRIINLQDIP